MEVWLIVIGIVGIAFGGAAMTGAPYVPSLKRDVAKSFDELYALGADDKLVDIGCGDGIVLREAAKRGARAIGYEINPIMVVIAKLICRKYDDIQVKQANFWRIDVPDDTTIVYTFGDSRDIERMAEWVRTQATRLNRPLYFMSYGFRLEGLQSLRSRGAHLLYELKPLHQGKPQV